MGESVLVPALLFLALAVTQNLAQRKTEPCPDNKQRCPDTGNCQYTCEKALKVNISAALVVKDLISAETPVEFTIQDLLKEVQSVNVRQGAMVKVVCPTDSTIVKQVTKGRNTSRLTKDKVISVGDTIKLSVEANRSRDLPSLYRCLVTTKPDTTIDPVVHFGLIAAILPPLAKTDVILKNITLTRDETLSRVPLSALIQLRRPGFDIDVGAFAVRAEEQSKGIKQIEESPAVALLLKKLRDTLTEHKDVTKNVELLIPKNPGSFNLTFRDADKSFRSLTGAKINIGAMQKTWIYIDKPISAPIGLTTLTVTTFSKFVRIPKGLAIGIEVTKNNFPPFLKERRAMEPKLLSSTTNSLEFQCGKHVLDLFDDKNTHDTLSCVILFATSASKGTWKYQENSDEWKNVPVRRLANTNDTISLEAVVISEHGKFKFLLDSSTQEMDFKVAVRYTSIFFLATDGTNLQNPEQFPYKLNLTLKKCENDPKYPCLHGPNTAVSRRLAHLYVYPQCSRNCDNEIVCGDQVSTEKCPKCGKGTQLNECTDTCYDPRDQNKKMEGRDCREKCDYGDYQLYTIPGGNPMCLPTGLTDAEIQQHICVNINKGELNKCQRCYGGNTTKTKTEGLDRCGTCDGDGSCVDSCDGIPNGPKKIDTCGRCLDQKSTDFNSKTGSTLKLGTITPDKIVAVGKITFEITGCNFHLLQGAPTCSLKKGDIEIQLETEFDSPKLFAKQDMTGVDTGVYSLHCVRKASKVPTLEGIDVTVFATPSISSINPSSTNIQNEVNVNLCGSDLNSDTGKLKCAMTCPFPLGSKMAQRSCLVNRGDRYIIMDASITMNACVRCHSADVFKRIYEPGQLQLAVLLEKQMLSSFQDLSPATITVTAGAPNLQQVTFDAFCKLILTFDRPVVGPRKASLLFVPAIDSKIYYKSKQLIVKLEDAPMFQEGENITVRPGLIKQRSMHSEHANANAEFSFIVPPPEEPPEVKILSRSLGNLTECQETVLSIKIKGVGSCVKLAYSWSVSMVGGGTDQEFSRKLGRTTTKRLRIGKGDVVLGNMYEITGKVDTPALEAKYIIERVAEEKTILVWLISRRNHKPTKSTVFKARVSMITCDATQSIMEEEESFKFRFNLKNDRNRTILSSKDLHSDEFVIPKGTLTGGQVYIINVTVYYGDNKATAQKLLRLPVSELEMYIDYDAQVNVNKKVEFNAKLIDPNNSPQLPLFTWTCKQEIRKGILQLCPKSLADIFIATATGVLSIPPGTMMSDSCYNVTVVAEAGRKIIKKTAKMCGVEHDPPKVRLALGGKPCEHCPLNLEIRLINQGPVAITFSCTYEKDGDCDGFNVQKTTFSKPYRGKIRQRIESTTGMWTPGKYSIDIHVTSKNKPDLGTTASLTTEVFQRPSLGTFQMNPAKGKALNTTFTLDINTEDYLDNYEIYYRKKSQPDDRLKSIGILIEESNSLEFKLPPGELDIMVRGCKEDRCTEKALDEAVDVSEISEEDALKVLTDLQDPNDLIEATAIMVGSGNRFTPSPELKKNLESATLKLANEISPEIFEESVEKIAKLLDVLPIVQMVEDLKKAVFDGLDKLLRDQTDASRRKRSVDDAIVQLLTVDQAQTMLLALVNLFQNVSENDITEADGERFVDDMETIGYRSCANKEVVYPDSDPVFLNTGDVLLKVHELLIDDDGFAIRNHNMTCTNCSEYTNKTALVTFGQSVTDKLQLWNCTDEITCTSACFVTAMMKKDFLSAGMGSIAKLDYNSSARASDIIVVLAASPETYQELTLHPFQNRMKLTVPVFTNAHELMSHSLQCNAWVDKAWSADSCLTSEPMMESDGTYRVVCSCVGFGYFSVMKEQIDESVTSTTSSTSSSESSTSSWESSSSASESSTSASESSNSSNDCSTVANDGSSTATTVTTSATTVRSAVKKEIKFKVSGSLTQLTGSTSSADVNANLTNQIAEHLGISSNRIQDLEMQQETAARRKRSSGQGSIIVTFVLVAGGSPSEMSVNDLENRLRNAIVSSNLTLTDISGNSLTVDPTFFQSRFVRAPPEPEEEKKQKLMPIIIGAVVGVLCLVLIVIIIVVVLKKKKKRSIIDDTPSPSVTPTFMSASSLNGDKQTKKPYVYGVSASPLPEKPGAEQLYGVSNQRYVVENDSGPSTSTTRTNSPRSKPNSRAATRSDVALSREGTATSHGSQHDSPRRDMTPIG